MTKTQVRSSSAPAPVGPYSQAVLTEGLVFASGQLGIDPSTGVMPPTVEEQAELALDNLKAVLEAGGSSLDRVVKTTVLLADMKDFARVNGIYARYFTEPFPARAAYQVAGLPLGGLVEIEAVALSGRD
ncbi:MAG: RidA family protein [Candidatus Fermentibacteraceae bacterium]